MCSYVFTDKTDSDINRQDPQPTRATRFFSRGAWHEAPVYIREDIAPGHRIMGPALIIEPNQPVVVEPGWRLEGAPLNHRLHKSAAPRAGAAHSHTTDSA